MAVGAGIVLRDGERPVTVITNQSPLGRALLGKTCGDEVVITTPHGERHFEITSIS